MYRTASCTSQEGIWSTAHLFIKLSRQSSNKGIQSNSCSELKLLDRENFQKLLISTACNFNINSEETAPDRLSFTRCHSAVTWLVFIYYCVVETINPIPTFCKYYYEVKILNNLFLRAYPLTTFVDCFKSMGTWTGIKSYDPQIESWDTDEDNTTLEIINL